MIRQLRLLSAKIGVILILGVVASCGSNRKIAYFRNVPDSITNSSLSVSKIAYQEPRIQHNDILQVTIQTLDPQANTVIGASVTATTPIVASGNNGTSSISGFLVDSVGMIELPLVGKVQVGGLTTAEAREVIRKKATIFYKEPVVNVRFSNFTVTVIGEVNRPSIYIVPNEKVSILDIIGMAGDLTIYGKRDNVLLIREENGNKMMTRFNLNSTDLFLSPFFYLKQGDVVYVEPNNAKVATNDIARTRNLTIITASISLLTIIFSRVNFN